MDLGLAPIEDTPLDVAASSAASPADVGVPSALFGAVILSGLIHILLLLVGGARRGFEATFRTTCFVMGAVNVIYLIPYCIAGFIAPICFFISLTVGIARAHETSGGKAAVAVLVPTLLPFVALIGIYGLLIIQAIAGAGG